MLDRKRGARQRMVSPDLNMEKRLRSGGKEVTDPKTPYTRRKVAR